MLKTLFNTMPGQKFLGTALFALVFGGASAASAGCVTLSVQLTAYQQDLVEEQVSETLVKSTVVQIKITTQDLLNSLAQHHGYGNSFSVGSSICFHSEGTVQIRDSSGAWVLTVDDAALPFGEGGEGLIAPTSMSFNLVSGRLTFSQRALSGLEFHVSPQLDFVVAGLSISKASATYPAPEAKVSAKSQVAGEGEVLGTEAVFAGSLSLKGMIPIE